MHLARLCAWLQDAFVYGFVGGGEAAECYLDAGVESGERFEDGFDGDLCGLLYGIAVDTGANGWKRYGRKSVGMRKRQGCAVAASKCPLLSAVASVPNWPNGMNDILCRELVAFCDLRRSRPTATELPARFEQLRSSRPVDRTVNASAA